MHTPHTVTPLNDIHEWSGCHTPHLQPHNDCHTPPLNLNLLIKIKLKVGMINFVCHQYNLYFLLTESLQVSCNPVPGKGFMTSPTSDKQVDEDTFSAMNGILLVIVARIHYTP